MRGAERVFDSIAGCWPDAPIYTSVYSAEGTEGRFSSRSVHTSWLQRFSVEQNHFRLLFPLYPGAIERLPVAEHDLVVSSSSAFAHGVRPGPGATHVCACHTPFRYIWHEREFALKAVPGPMRRPFARYLERIRRWDLEAAGRVDHYIALSSLAKQRIEDAYDREAGIVLPGIEIDRFEPGTPEDFFLFVGHLVPHKGAELVLQAAERVGAPMQVVGDGPDLERLRERYGARATFHGHLSDADLASLYPRARALVIPRIEEFGLAGLEAQASGRPVLVADGGGARDTVIDGETGVLIEPGDVDCLAEAMREVDFDAFDQDRIRSHAEQFSLEGFRDRFVAEVERLTSQEPSRLVG